MIFGKKRSGNQNNSLQKRLKLNRYNDLDKRYGWGEERKQRQIMEARPEGMKTSGRKNNSYINDIEESTRINGTE